MQNKDKGEKENWTAEKFNKCFESPTDGVTSLGGEAGGR